MRYGESRRFRIEERRSVGCGSGVVDTLGSGVTVGTGSEVGNGDGSDVGPVVGEGDGDGPDPPGDEPVASVGCCAGATDGVA